MANVTLYLPDDLLDRARAAAAADRRSLSQWLVIRIEQALPLLPPGAFPPGHPRRSGLPRQVDLEELAGAVASAVRSRPRRAPRRPK